MLSPVGECRKINRETSTYPSEAFEELLERFETPNNLTKWDSPLFSVVPFSQILPEELDEVCKSICTEKAKKPPTFATSAVNNHICLPAFNFGVERSRLWRSNRCPRSDNTGNL